MCVYTTSFGQEIPLTVIFFLGKIELFIPHDAILRTRNFVVSRDFTFSRQFVLRERERQIKMATCKTSKCKSTKNRRKCVEDDLSRFSTSTLPVFHEQMTDVVKHEFGTAAFSAIVSFILGPCLLFRWFAVKLRGCRCSWLCVVRRMVAGCLRYAGEASSYLGR